MPNPPAQHSRDDLRPILITGATGQVGGQLARDFALLREYDGRILTPIRAELDLTSADSIRSYLQQTKPRWIINPAAYTAVDKAESEPELAHAINADAPRILGEEARRIGAPVLHFSTDYVFDGSGTRPRNEKAPTRPINVYGASKLAGEQALAASGAAHIILRTSWVYSATGKNFLLTILRLARERAETSEPLKIVADQFGSPTSAEELSRIAIQIVKQCELSVMLTSSLPASVETLGGLFHVSGAGQTSWYGFAREILRLRHQQDPVVSFAPLVPIASNEFPTPARRPANSRLDCRKLAHQFDIRPLPWKEALAEVLAELPFLAASPPTIPPPPLP